MKPINPDPPPKNPPLGSIVSVADLNTAHANARQAAHDAQEAKKNQDKSDDQHRQNDLDATNRANPDAANAALTNQLPELRDSLTALLQGTDLIIGNLVVFTQPSSAPMKAVFDELKSELLIAGYGADISTTIDSITLTVIW